MSARSRRPTDDATTEIYDPARHEDRNAAVAALEGLAEPSALGPPPEPPARLQTPPAGSPPPSTAHPSPAGGPPAPAGRAQTPAADHPPAPAGRATPAGGNPPAPAALAGGHPQAPTGRAQTSPVGHPQAPAVRATPVGGYPQAPAGRAQTSPGGHPQAPQTPVTGSAQSSSTGAQTPVGHPQAPQTPVTGSAQSSSTGAQTPAGHAQTPAGRAQTPAGGGPRRPAPSTLPAPAGAPPPPSAAASGGPASSGSASSAPPLTIPKVAPYSAPDLADSLGAHDFENDATKQAARPPRRSVELATPTQIDPPPDDAGVPHGGHVGSGGADEHAGSGGASNRGSTGDGGGSGPIAVVQTFPRGAERSEPIRVISMKDNAEAPRPREDRVPLHVQLRSLAEVAGQRNKPEQLGRLAPPRDPRQAHARQVRGNILLIVGGIGLAAAIALVIWLVAGR